MSRPSPRYPFAGVPRSTLALSGFALSGFLLLGGCTPESHAATPIQVVGASVAPPALIPRPADPDWVVAYAVPDAAGPPEDPCASAPRTESPGVERAKTPSSSSEPNATTATAGMLQMDLAPGALNEKLPETIRARLHFDTPLDLAAVAPEPLRGKPEDLAKVAAVLAKAARKEGHTRLSFWGASHVAGEYLTGELRRLLQDRYGDAGHGFVMPAAPWKGYRASDANLCTGGTWTNDFHNRRGGRDDGLFGPSGISVEALAPTSFGWVQTTKTNPHGRAATRFEVYYLRQPGGGGLDVHVDDVAPIRVATKGEQGPGAAVFTVPDGGHRFAVSPAGDGPVRLFGASMERDVPGVLVDAMGVSGRTASSWLSWDPALQGAYLARRPVDLAVLAYGTNEANDPGLNEEKYRTSLRSVLTRMRAVLPDAACLLIGPSDRVKKVSGSTYAIWSHTEWVARVQRELGPEYGCVTWDLQEVTGGPGSMGRWMTATPGLAAQDGIHYTAAGYREVAVRLLAALDAAGS